MSQQSIRSPRRRRASFATAAAVAVAALFAPAAQAADLLVKSNADGPAGACDANCTLRDAIEQARSNYTTYTIRFAPSVTGTIRLTHGPLSFVNSHDEHRPLTIEGPGADALAISGDTNADGIANSGDVRVLNIDSKRPVTISGLTLTGGYSSKGGALLTGPTSDVTIEDAALTGNVAQGGDGGAVAARSGITIVRSSLTGNRTVEPRAGGGGAIHFEVGDAGSDAALTISDSTISGNEAERVAAAIETHGPTTIVDSQISDNASLSWSGAIQAHARLTVVSSTISGNSTAYGDGGGILVFGPDAPTSIRDSAITGNTAPNGGGIAVIFGSDVEIEDSTIAGNKTVAGTDPHYIGPLTGGGIWLGELKAEDQVRIARSTISGNEARSGVGGGIMVNGPVEGEVEVTQSTISSNVAHAGAGVQIGGDWGDGNPQPGVIAFENSTIASNTAVGAGGGIRLEASRDNWTSPWVSPTIPLRSTIVADNTPQDFERVPDSTSGGFDLAFSLVEQPGNVPLSQHPGRPSIVGQDPQLGPLTDNGGPTATQLPAPTSPAVEHGHGNVGDTDQRGLERIVNGEGDNPPGGDGTDIGAVELQNPPPKPMPDGPGTPPPPPPGPGVTPPAADLSPEAVITANGLRSARRRGRVVSGTASDDHAVAAVHVAIVRKRGGLCKQLLVSGRFTRYARCTGPKVFLPAQGTSKWSFRLDDRLPRGAYVVYARATDDAGQAQSSFGPRSRRSFRVRRASRDATTQTALCGDGSQRRSSGGGFGGLVDCRRQR